MSLLLVIRPFGRPKAHDIMHHLRRGGTRSDGYFSRPGLALTKSHLAQVTTLSQRLLALGATLNAGWLDAGCPVSAKTYPPLLLYQVFSKHLQQLPPIYTKRNMSRLRVYFQGKYQGTSRPHLRVELFRSSGSNLCLVEV